MITHERACLERYHINAVPGDYLFRDYAAYGNTAGLWGILRVTHEMPPATAAAQ